MLAILIAFFCASIDIYGASADELVIVSPHWEGFKREFEWGFQRWYQNTYGTEIEVRWFDVGGASDIQKYLLSTHAEGKQSGIDVMFGGGSDPFIELKSKGLLRPIQLESQLLNALPASVQGNQLRDSEGAWFSVNLTTFGILYNKPLLRSLHVPSLKHWEDLGDARLKGWVGSADPRKSGSVRFIYELLLQYYGWERGWREIYKIASNVRTFSSTSSQTPKDISLGEVAAGMLIDSYARDAIRYLGEDSVGMIIPDEIPSVFGDGIAVLAGAPHGEEASRFVKFALSEEGQGLLMRRVGSPGGPKQYELGRLSVRPDQYKTDSSLIPFSDPFMKEASFRYDPEKATGRWRYVTALIGAIAVDLQNEIATARYEGGIRLDSLPAPITEEALRGSVNAKMNPQILAVEIRENFRKVLGVQKSSTFNIFTLLLGIFILCTLILKKIRRTLK